MSSELALRIADCLLALFWVWQLLISLVARRIGGKTGFRWSRSERPAAYWGGIIILSLMVLHFGGLAWIGQKPG